MGFFSFFTKEKKETLDKGLEKTKESFFGKIARAVAGKSKVDDDVLDNLEEVLVTSDVGVDTTLSIINRIEERVARDKYVGTDELNNILREEISNLLTENNSSDTEGYTIPEGKKPYVIMVVGVNGVGKTTLFRMIMGIEEPTSGTFEVGETVTVAYVDQQHKDLDPNKSIYQAISNGQELIKVGKKEVNARAYLSRFNFSGGDQEKLIGVLSGGERNRLHLAMTLKEGGNVILLDEPTNDLDINTIRALEDALENFAGCAVVISHDRWFLDRICTHILSFEDEEPVYYEGTYSDYEEWRINRNGGQEKTARYRKLMAD